MSHNKDDVLPAAAALWPEILISLTNIDQNILNPRKEHPCPLCGGNTRFRYVAKHELPFYCNSCGSRAGINMLMELTGLGFADAINTVGDWLNLIPTERLEVIKREHEARTSFPEWYKFEIEVFDTIKKAAKVDLSAWQRVNGLQMLDILKHGDDALVPLLNESGNPCDFVAIDINGDWKTTGGNLIIPPCFHSVFGVDKGKRTYIVVSPFHAAHASVFMQKQVICCYSIENIWDVAKKHEDEQEIVIIVTNIEEVKEADALKFKQLTFDKKTNRVNRRLFDVGEIVKEKNKEVEDE